MVQRRDDGGGHWMRGFPDRQDPGIADAEILARPERAGDCASWIGPGHRGRVQRLEELPWLGVHCVETSGAPGDRGAAGKRR